MNIYLAKRDATWDEYDGFVVVAKSEESARNLIKCELFGDYSSEFEFDFICEYTGTNTEEFIILESYLNA